jgi:ABC-2 type transport system permease protein
VTETRAAGTIYDLGYQRYTGTRLGQGHAFWQLLVYSFKATFGMGRGARARLAPIIIGVIVFIPAIAQIAVASMTGVATFINYSTYLEFTSFLVALFTASQAPEIVVPDRQHGVMSLYLSRPLSGTDYALAKISALVLAMFALTFGPQLFLFLGKIFLGTAPWTAFKAEYAKLLPIIGGTLGTSVYMATVGLAISCRASRRAFANAGVIAWFLFLPAIQSIFYSISSGDARRYSVLANPVLLTRGFADWLFRIEAQRRSIIGRVDLPGTAYLYTILGISLIAGGLVVLKYREADV